MASDERDWLETTLDAGIRRGIADLLERVGGDSADPHLLKMFRSNRDELLLDRTQARKVLTALETDNRLSALRARLRGFVDEAP